MRYIIAFLCALSLILGGALMMDTRQDAAMTSAINTDSEATVAVIGAVQSLIESHNSLKEEVKTDINDVRSEIADVKSDIAALKQSQTVAGSGGGGMPQIVIISPSAPGATVAEAQSANKPLLNLKPSP